MISRCIARVSGFYFIIKLLGAFRAPPSRLFILFDFSISILNIYTTPREETTSIIRATVDSRNENRTRLAVYI